MKKFLILFITINILITPALALDFDLSVDDEIRKNYNPSKIEEDASLPQLPSILTTPQKSYTPVSNTVTKNSTVQKTIIQTQPSTSVKPIPKAAVGNFATIKTGTKIRAKLVTNISDRSKKGTKITFVSKYPVSTTYFTIPSGTVLQGEVVSSHKPQLTGNGGLLVINVNSMIINDSTQPINGYVTKANHKKIFYNKIKGKRRYVRSVAKSLKPGCHFFTKMMRVTSNLANDGSSMILTPFSVTAALVAIGTNTMVSPVLGLFHKGDTLYLPSGCDFEIKLAQDVFIYN